MSTSRNGPILVAKSPLLEQQFVSMSLSGAASSSSAPAPQPLALSHWALAYFEEQRKIGTQWPKNPYPMKYDISVYRMADAAIKKCLASVDSPDWRIREVSIRATDAAIDLLDEMLRRPIAEESLKSWRSITAQNKEKFFINVTLHTQDIPNFLRAKPTETRSEQARFPINPSTKSVVLAVQKEKLQEIGLRVLTFVVPGPKQSPGPVLLRDLVDRVWNITKKMFQPEFACMMWLAASPQSPSVVKWTGKSEPLCADSMITGLACETARRLIKSDMSPRLVDSLVEKYLREVECTHAIHPVKSALEKGLTGDSISISW